MVSVVAQDLVLKLDAESVCQPEPEVIVLATLNTPTTVEPTHPVKAVFSHNGSQRGNAVPSNQNSVTPSARKERPRRRTMLLTAVPASEVSGLRVSHGNVPSPKHRDLPFYLVGKPDVVRVKKRDQVSARRLHGSVPGPSSLHVSPVLEKRNPGAKRFCHCHRIIGRRIVHDDHFHEGVRLGECALNRFPEKERAIVTRDYDADEHATSAVLPGAGLDSPLAAVLPLGIRGQDEISVIQKSSADHVQNPVLAGTKV